MDYIRKFNIPLPLDPAEVVVQFNSKVYLIWVQDEAFCAPTCTTSKTAIINCRFLLGLAPEKIVILNKRKFTIWPPLCAKLMQLLCVLIFHG